MTVTPNPLPPHVLAALRAGNLRRGGTSKAGAGAPGQVPRSGRLIWYVVAAVAVAAFFAGYMLRSAGL